MQSAYRKYHSVKTALLQVVSDIHQATDNKCEAVLVLLDLSAAFYTIDHTILPSKPWYRNGFFKIWFIPYITPCKILLYC